MSITADRKYESFLNRMSRVQSLVEDGNLDEAWRLCEKAVAFCLANSIVSATVFWTCAVVADNKAIQSRNIEDYATALRHIREAVRVDPLSVTFWRSYIIVVDRIRAALEDAANISDPIKEKLYELLLEADEAETAHILAYARHLRAVDRIEEALCLLEALTLLHPSDHDALTMLAETCRAAGDETRSRSIATRAAAVLPPTTVFGHQPMALA